MNEYSFSKCLGTRNHYDVLICRVLVKAFLGKSLRQIRPLMIEEFKQELLRTPTRHDRRHKPITVNRFFRVTVANLDGFSQFSSEWVKQTKRQA